MQAAAGENTSRLDCPPRDFLSDWIFDQHANGIVQDKDTITMKYGFRDTTRVIHMTISEPPADFT